MSLLTHSTPLTPDTSFRQTIRTGVAVIALTFGVGGIWAGTAPLSAAALAPGIVAVAGSNKPIQHLEGGIVRAVRIKDGARVSAGQPLIELDPTRPQGQVDSLRGQLDAERALESRLLAERDGAENVAFPDDLTTDGAAPDLAATLSGQRDLFMARRTALLGQVSILEQRRAQADEQKSGIVAQITAQDRQLSLIRQELKGLRDLEAKGYAPRTRLLALEREESAIMGERGRLLGEQARFAEALGETDLQILQIRRSFQEQVAKELRDAQTRLIELRERLRLAQDVLDRTIIRAGVDGIVVGLAVHAVGAVIPPGETLMQVVPDADDLVVEAHLQVADIDQVRPGMAADVHFSAFQATITPVVTGHVLTVSADRLSDKRTGAPFYAVRIAVSEAELKRLGGLRIVPGMAADSYIRLGERTLLGYLAEPLTRIVSRALREG